jgi:hypothetical protein
MTRPSDPLKSGPMRPDSAQSAILVAGPSSSLTIPGIVLSQIVQALALSNKVVRIEVDLGTDFDTGLHRAPSLAVAHDDAYGNDVISFEAPYNSRLRAQAFREWISPDVGEAIGFVWPGIDNSWIRQFLFAAKGAGASATVVCVSLPKTTQAKILALADSMADADLVLVGNEADAKALKIAFGPAGPIVETHRALSLHGRTALSAVHRITAFLPKDNIETLGTLLAAYDAIPEAWIEGYHLRVAMRHRGAEAADLVAKSYHSEFVELVGEDISSLDLRQMCEESSALIIADPAFDSRAFSIAVDCGVAVVVLASAQLPEVGRGYVGALLADLKRPVSVHVALTHALRLAELQFPRPDAWNELVDRLIGAPLTDFAPLDVLEPASRA